MARKPRKKSGRGIYHVILRGNNRQDIFVDDDDRQKLLEIIVKYKEISQYNIFAYCLMTNHLHILLQENREPVGLIMQRIASGYVIWFNNRHDRCGHLFQERFKSEVIDSDSYFLTVLRYIHQNPVKAKIVNAAADYKWSSYNQYTERDRFVDIKYALSRFSDNFAEAVKQFEQFNSEKNNDVCLEVNKNNNKISDDDLRQIISHKFGLDAIEIGKEIREKQDEILRAAKKVDGASIRQIARVTGLGSTRVWKA